MPTAQSQRFAAEIVWLALQNASGQKIPPFSCVEAQNWVLPDISGSDVNLQSPYMVVDQPSDPINPDAIYLTGSISIPAGGYGVAARPGVIPQLGSLASGGESSNVYAPMSIVGPVSGRWTLSPSAPGFIVLATPQQNLSLVRVQRGPWVGKLVDDINNSESGKVAMWAGSTGSETAGVTIPNVYNRFSDLKSGTSCLFDWTGSGYELLAADPC